MPRPADPVTAYAKKVVAGKIVAGPHVRNACKRHLRDIDEAINRGLYWDLDAVEHVLGFFPTCLHLAAGQFEGEPFNLHPPQEFIVGSLFGWKQILPGKPYEEWPRRFRRAYVEAGKGSGKALALDTPIPTPSGWTTMGALRDGDLVLDDLGKPCRVLRAHPVQIARPCYRVEFDDGEAIIADAEHLWRTEMRRSPATDESALKGVPKSLWGSWRKGVRSTAEIAATLRYSNGKYQSANHSVPLAGSLDLPEVSLPIPPYLTGAWLGDGDSDSARLTVARSDWQIVEEIGAEGVPIVEQIPHAEHIARVSLSAGRFGKRSTFKAAVAAATLRLDTFAASQIAAVTGCSRDRVSRFLATSGYFECVAAMRAVGNGGGMIAGQWRVAGGTRRALEQLAAAPQPIAVRLRELNLLGNKHIPIAYLRASRVQRLALLQGLMDTDGSIDAMGACEFCSVNPRLAADVLELIRSLGIKVATHESDATLGGRIVGRRWRIAFHPAPDVPVFRLVRKRDRQYPRHTRRRLSGDRRIVRCDPVPSVPVRCITVDSASRMFLAGRGMVPTHNSPLAGGIGLYCMLADGEARAEVYAAASKKDQAQVLFGDAVAMWEQSPKLKKRIQATGLKTVTNLYDIHTASFFRPIAGARGTGGGMSGPRPSCALCDELHEHPDGTVIEMLERGFKFRRQPLLFMITNSGSDRNSVCWQEHAHAVGVAAGDKEDDTSFSYVCALDEGDSPLFDRKCWIKANPLLGVTITEDYLAINAKQARDLPGKQNEILRLHFCQWTDAENAWMPRATIERCVADFDPREHEGKDIWVGADLARVQDFLALGYACRTGKVEVERINQDGTRSTVWAPTYDVWADAWTPGDTLVERAIRDSAHYDVWAREGWIQAPPGNRIRFDYPAARLAEMSRLYNIVRLAYDDHAWDRFEEELDALGLDLPIISHPQGGNRRAALPREEIRQSRLAREEPPRGLWMPGSVVATEALILEGRIRLLNNPALFSGFLGATFEEDPYGHRWLSKRKATTRIDILVAIVMAIGAAEMQAEIKPIDISALVA